MKVNCVLTRNIICPYCGSEDVDSWECEDSSDDYICGNCEEIFGYERIVTVQYTSFKLNDLKGSI